jgi:aromatic ring-cleaving dioxygenase
MIRNPEHSVIDGYDIHLVFQEAQKIDAQRLFSDFMDFLIQNKIPHKKSKIFDNPVGPWPCPMWQTILPQSDRIYTDLGHCVSWLMLNRRNFSVMIHPNTRKENDLGGSYEDHIINMLWLGPPLSLNIKNHDFE